MMRRMAGAGASPGPAAAFTCIRTFGSTVVVNEASLNWAEWVHGGFSPTAVVSLQPSASANTNTHNAALLRFGLVMERPWFKTSDRLGITLTYTNRTGRL